jgi:hypothetical protein
MHDGAHGLFGLKRAVSAAVRQAPGFRPVRAGVALGGRLLLGVAADRLDVKPAHRGPGGPRPPPLAPTSQSAAPARVTSWLSLGLAVKPATPEFWEGYPKIPATPLALTG